MNTNIITPPIWLQLSVEERLMLRELLRIPRTGGSIVENNHVVSDGCTQADLAAITLVSLQTLLDSDGVDFFSLWGEAVKNAQALVKEKTQAQVQLAQSERILEESKNTEVTAGIMMNSIRKLPLEVQISVYQQLSNLFKPVETKVTPLEVKPETITTNIQTNEQNQSSDNISGNERKEEGSGTTKKNSKGKVLPVSPK